jgi:hypothetical protein
MKETLLYFGCTCMVLGSGFLLGYYPGYMAGRKACYSTPEPRPAAILFVAR